MTARVRPSAVGGWAFLALAVALTALSRVHLGLRHDARLYFGDALARLDPQGVGRDLIFTHDGQFGFSLYTPVLALIVDRLGLGAAVTLMSGLGLALWLVALLWLASRLLDDLPSVWRRAAVVLVLVAAPYYGAFEVFAYGEAFATPRILVEALGMAALAAWLSGRRRVAFALLAAGLALHPIMALCGLAVLFAVLCLENPRWLWAVAAGLIGLGLAIALRLPLADRLLLVMDLDWLAISRARSPPVFVSLWPMEAWGRLAVHTVTLGLAAALSTGRTRRLMIAVLAAGLLGLAAAWLADRLSLVLPLQVQMWRTLSLMAVFAAAGLAVCFKALADRGPGGVLTLCALATGWTYLGWGAVPLVAATVALAAFLTLRRIRWTAPVLAQRIMIGATFLLILLWGLVRARALAAGLAALPDSQGGAPALLWNSGLPGAVAAGLALWLARRPAVLKALPALCGAGLLALLASGLWNQQGAFVRQRDAGPDSKLMAMLADRPGEVLWLAGDVEPWALAQRPSWASKFQGAGVVLSRPLAVALDARIDRLIALDMVSADWRTPFHVGATAPRAPSPRQVRAFCAFSDAPAWIVLPLEQGRAPEAALGARVWTPRAPYRLELAGRWFTAASYAAIPCAGG